MFIGRYSYFFFSKTVSQLILVQLSWKLQVLKPE